MLISVILPIAVKELYCYRVPENLTDKIIVGGRVAVELGARKVYSAIVYKILDTQTITSTSSKLKEIITVLDDSPVVSSEQIKLWEWISSYYMASMGELMRRFFPASMRVDTYSELINSNFTFTNRFLSRTEKFITLSKNTITSQSELNQKIESLSRAKVLTLALLKVCDILKVKVDDKEILHYIDTPLKHLIKEGVQSEKIRELIKKECIELYEKEVKIEYNIQDIETIIKGLPKLSDTQHIAYNSIVNSFLEKDTTLLYGVSGAGKTEVYSHLIAEYIKNGDNVLLLLPDLALSTQLIKRLERYFGDLMLIYNGRQTPNERHAIYNRILYGEKGRLIVTTHSGIALPLKNLGLVVVDEEHSESYKSTYISPRLNARDTATVLTKIHGAKSLLVSATPSIETFYNAKTEKYGFTELKERFNKIDSPRVKIIERRLISTKEKREKGYSSDNRYFSDYLLKRIDETLSKNEQVILYQNRRGYNSVIECSECGYVPVCPECNISLSYHKSKGSLMCHYCSYTRPVDIKCGECGSTTLSFWGIGTENVEEKIKEYFPDSKVVRVDGDTASSAKNFSKIISDIENREVDIIVGTNLITKGFDFKSVSLVGVINCDSILSYADFRASERAFSLLNQLMGRTTRSSSQGEIIIQTNKTQKSVVEDIAIGSYDTMYKRELIERIKFGYPPFSKIIELTMQHVDPNFIDQASHILADELRILFGNRILGPTIPQIEKRNGKYFRIINIKIESSASLVKAKNTLTKSIDNIKKTSHFRGIIFSYNVDC